MIGGTLTLALILITMLLLLLLPWCNEITRKSKALLCLHSASGTFYGEIRAEAQSCRRCKSTLPTSGSAMTSHFRARP